MSYSVIIWYVHSAQWLVKVVNSSPFLNIFESWRSRRDWGIPPCIQGLKIMTANSNTWSCIGSFCHKNATGTLGEIWMGVCGLDSSNLSKLFWLLIIIEHIYGEQCDTWVHMYNVYWSHQSH
jgi:hypothetical protein